MSYSVRCAVSFVLLTGALLCGCGGTTLEPVDMSRETYRDKCRGAWAGQIIGVSYGAPYEFRYVGQIQEDPIRPWKPHFIGNGLSQDDLYVELTWIEAMEEFGLDITYEQAGKAFADTTYGLAHANNTGRENVRHGIMPPASGHPEHTRHADDIDFQIEADVFGIICPGLPQESNRLCDIFGHIMNYGDGVYGGMFVAGMYAAAYLEDEDVEKVLEQGLACIPAESLYHQCISDVITWYHENPDDWRATWHKLEEKWQDDIDCVPGSDFNIDAKINGAYIALSLLYGEGDVARTMEIGVRCGQDSDCNPSNAAGVLGCMYGFTGLPEAYTAGFADLKDKTFADNDRTFDDVVAASERLTERIIQRLGGGVSEERFVIPVQPPRAAPLEQWENQMETLEIAVPRTDVERWDKRFRIVVCGHEMGPGYIPDFAGRDDVMLLVPRRDGPAIMEALIDVPALGHPMMAIPVSSFGSDGDWIGDFRLKVMIDGEMEIDRRICTRGTWNMVYIDVDRHRGRTVPLRIEVHQEGDYHWERAYFGRVEVRP